MTKPAKLGQAFSVTDGAMLRLGRGVLKVRDARGNVLTTPKETHIKKEDNKKEKN